MDRSLLKKGIIWPENSRFFDRRTERVGIMLVKEAISTMRKKIMECRIIPL